MDYRLPESLLPARFSYPRGFLRVVDLGLVNLEPWYLLSGDLLVARYRGLRDRFPEREYVPFAARQDRDDVACFDGAPPAVVIVHDFSGPGWERRAVHDDFYSWLRRAVDDLIEFDT